MFATSDLSYIESRLTDVSVSETRSAIAMTVEFTSEITLAPPLLPFPLLVILTLSYMHYYLEVFLMLAFVITLYLALINPLIRICAFSIKVLPQI
jgi:hypothetical protein